MIWNLPVWGNLFVRPRRAAVVAMVCLALVALLAVLQVAHVHQVSTDADHCPLCIALHAAAPASVAAAIIILVQLGISLPVCKVLPAARPWHPSLFTRPPPLNA